MRSPGPDHDRQPERRPAADGPAPTGQGQRLRAVAEQIVARFGPGATLPSEHDGLAALAAATAACDHGAVRILTEQLVHAGYLRGVLSVLAGAVVESGDLQLALKLAEELADAVDLGLARDLLDAIRLDASGPREKWASDSPWRRAHALLARICEDLGDPAAAYGHHEAILAVDVDDARALDGVRRTAPSWARTPGAHALAMLDEIERIELEPGPGHERYRIERPVGRGRFAIVYRAKDQLVDRDVALKILRRGGRSGRADRLVDARFFKEATALGRVRSPFVVALYDVQPHHRFIALEYCDGGTLRLALRHGRLGPDDLAWIGPQLGAALTAVHATGAIHRDIKPANLLLRSGPAPTVALGDFGLAIAARLEGQAATGQELAGTLRYLAPELRRGRASSPESDLYAAGVTLLELALAPAPLPPELDQLESAVDPRELIPAKVPAPERTRLERWLDPVPERRVA